MCVAADAVQAGPASGAAAWHSHTDAAGHHQRSVAVHQDSPPAGPGWTRVHQLWQVPRTGAWLAGITVLLLVGFGFLFRPHRSTAYVDVAYCYRQSSMVCLSIWCDHELCQKWLNQSRYCLDVDSGGPKEPCIRWGPGSCVGRGNFEGGRDAPLQSIGITGHEWWRCGLCVKLLWSLVFSFNNLSWFHTAD